MIESDSLTFSWSATTTEDGRPRRERLAIFNAELGQRIYLSGELESESGYTPDPETLHSLPRGVPLEWEVYSARIEETVPELVARSVPTLPLFEFSDGLTAGRSNDGRAGFTLGGEE